MSGFDLLILIARLRGAAALVEIGITGDRIWPAHLLWLTDEAGREQVYEMVTVSAAARALGIDDHRLARGGRADLVTLDAPDTLEALRSHAAPRLTIRAGRPR